MEPIRVLLADDSPIILDMVVNILKPNFVVAGAFTDGELAIQKFSSLMPDVVVLDICMGNISGFDVAKRLKEMDRTVKFMFLTVHEDPDFVHAAMSLGASGYVFKSAVNRDLIAAIHAVSEGKRFYPSTVPIASN
jgi:DNA-binding NarL/FixJ family response regulator